MKKKHLIYFIIGSIVWIAGTNLLLAQFPPSSALTYIEHFKEVVYVVATGFLFYFYIRKSEELNAAKMDEQRLSTLINSMVDFVNFKDGEGRWIEANEYGLNLYGLKGVDFRGKKDRELAEYSQDYAEALRYCEITDNETWQNGKITRVEEVLTSPEGRERIFDTIKVPLYYEDGSRKGLVIIGRDITERRQLINLLEESRQQYKSLFDNSPDIVYMTDLEGTFLNINSRFKEATGYEPSHIIGRQLHAMLPKTYFAPLTEYFTKVMEDKIPQHIELEFKRKNGEPIILECTSLPIVINGVTTGMIGYGVDVTRIRETEERLRRSEKLSVVGELAASIAHEIRNPLTSLIGFVKLLQSDDEKQKFFYSIMSDELNRINYIVGELLLLAKPQEIKFEKADLKGLLYDVISLLQSEASFYNVQIDFRCIEDEIWIECEPNQLKQLFINIIKNAIEASKPGRKVTIFVSGIWNDKVSISIEDEGSGISKELLEKLGEPFYSSKEKGTGLGLTVSYKIIESHHGKMVFSSELDKGTQVLIELPSKAEKAAMATAKF